MHPLYRAIKALLTPLIAASCAGAVLSGGYLVVMDAFGAVWTVALGFFLSPLIFPLLLLPAAFFGGLVGMAGERKGAAGAFQALAAGWLVLVLSLWAGFVFGRAGDLVMAEEPLRSIAKAWCVSAGVAPWAVFARGDRENVFFTMLVLMLAAGCAAAALTGAATFGSAFLKTAGVMALLVAAQAAFENVFLKKG